MSRSRWCLLLPLLVVLHVHVMFAWPLQTAGVPGVANCLGCHQHLNLNSVPSYRHSRRHHMDAALAAVPELTEDDRRKLHNCELFSTSS